MDEVLHPKIYLLKAMPLKVLDKNKSVAKDAKNSKSIVEV
jgi:hypothetical protein